MRVLTGSELEATLDDLSLVEALRAAFRAGGETPLRHHHALGGQGTSLLLMPSWLPDGPIGVKVVTVQPENPGRDLPSVQGVYLLLDRFGVPLAVMDGSILTRRRTGAASALAATYLARSGSRTLLMVGTGALAPHLVMAHASVRPIREVWVWGRREERARALALRLARPGLRVEATTDLEGAARNADVICCATLSTEPLILGSWLRGGVHVDLVGGFTPEMREVDDEAVGRARVFVDTRSGALREAGDILVPLSRGVLREEDIRGDLFDLVRGERPGRTGEDDITLFKSVGSALEDLAAAQLALARLPP